MLSYDVSYSTYTDLFAFLHIHVGFLVASHDQHLPVEIIKFDRLDYLSKCSKDNIQASSPWKFDNLSGDVAFTIWGQGVEQFLH